MWTDERDQERLPPHGLVALACHGSGQIRSVGVVRLGSAHDPAADLEEVVEVKGVALRVGERGIQHGVDAATDEAASIIAVVLIPTTAALWKIESKKSARVSSSTGIDTASRGHTATPSRPSKGPSPTARSAADGAGPEAGRHGAARPP